MTHGPYRCFLTDSGRSHINDHLDACRGLYPSIDTKGLDENSG
ncbi:hypothetical protein [Streptomyces sp. E-15]